MWRSAFAPAGKRLRRPASPVRAGWAEAAKKIAEGGDDELVIGEFGMDTHSYGAARQAEVVADVPEQDVLDVLAGG